MIRDFSRAQGDDIDLSGIDANAKAAGNQAFSFIGDKAFSGKAGELQYKNGIVAGDVNGDKAADFHIEIANHAGLPRATSSSDTTSGCAPDVVRSFTHVAGRPPAGGACASFSRRSADAALPLQRSWPLVEGAAADATAVGRSAYPRAGCRDGAQPSEGGAAGAGAASSDALARAVPAWGRGLPASAAARAAA